MGTKERIRLGLFGSGIARSKSPLLHELSGKLCGLEVSYERFDLDEIGLDRFEEQLTERAAEGFRGVNVTHPVKERAARLVKVTDPDMARVGSVNTVLLSDGVGFNTDYSGFIRAYRGSFGHSSPGTVLLVGAGGVGRAVAFALWRLDREARIVIVDVNATKAAELASELGTAGAIASGQNLGELAGLAAGATGLVNCTPLGMHGHAGSALPADLIGNQSWAFDAVYTPVETEFLRAAKSRGLQVMSGYELFFYQGIEAFEVFTGCQVDEASLRRELKRAISSD